MPELQIRLFGSPSILQDHEPVTGFVSSKATALVYYLAATNRTHSRDSLAALFWADVPEARAKKNLRDILSNLRKRIGPHLDITRQSVALTTPTEMVDVGQFELLVSTNLSTNQSTNQSANQNDLSAQQRRDNLTAAAALQSGEFLEGFYVSDAPFFEEWVLTERERFGQLALQVLNELVAESLHSGQFTNGIDYGLRALALAPLEESAHRHLMSLYAATGQNAAALEQYEQCCQILYDELGTEPSAETTEIFERISDRQASGQVHQITDDHLLPFVGRSDEITEINRLLASSDCRLLTLVGLGGVGKTRLALQVAIRNQHRFLDGTFLVELGPQESLEQFVTAIAKAVGLSLDLRSGGVDEAVDHLLEYLRTKSILLIIDNSEYLRPPRDTSTDLAQPTGHGSGIEDPVGLVSLVINSAPAVQIIATSRAQLGLRAEWLLEVSGLSAQPNLNKNDPFETQTNIDNFPAARNDATTLEQSTLQSDAVQLFLKRSRQAWVDFPQSDTQILEKDLIAINHICQLVGGMPLAIELAASWTSMLSCSEIQDEVTTGMEVLASTARDLPQRHRSLRAVFEQSWEMLTAPEQEILEKLSLFEGGFSRKAAQQIAGASLPFLQNLMQRSFLSRTGKERFGLHNLIQQYAYERLEQRPDMLLETQEMHARYFSQLLAQYQDALVKEETERAAILLASRGDNLRAAFDWVLTNKRFDLLEQMAEGLYQVFVIRGWVVEGISRFESAVHSLRLPQNLPEQDGAANHEESELAQAVLGKMMIRLGWLLQIASRNEEAQVHLANGLEWADKADRPLEKAFCLLGQANTHFELANYSQAEEIGEQSLAIYQQQRNQIGEARSLYCLGKIRLAKGETSKSRQNLAQALSLAQANRLSSTEAESLGVLGRVCWNQGDHTAAQHYFEEALAIFRQPKMANYLSEAKVLNELGFMAWSRGHLDEAEDYHIQARQIFQRIGNRQGEGNTLSSLGRVAERRKAYPEATRLYEQALIIHRESQDRHGEAMSLINLAFMSYGRSYYPMAEDYFAQSQNLCKTIGFRRFEALSIACRGLLACFRGEYDAGATLSREAINLSLQVESPVIEAYGWVHLGYALTALSDWAGAETAFQQGLELRRDSEQTDRLLDPLSGLAYLALQKDNLKSAKSNTDQILMVLNEHTLASALLPAQIHYVCYRVLQQDDEPEADHYIQMATKTLAEGNHGSLAKNKQAGYLREPLIQKALQDVAAASA